MIQDQIVFLYDFFVKGSYNRWLNSELLIIGLSNYGSYYSESATFSLNFLHFYVAVLTNFDAEKIVGLTCHLFRFTIKCNRFRSEICSLKAFTSINNPYPIFLIQTTSINL